MTFRWLERLLALGHSDELPPRMARHVRVTNALALVGAALSVASLPLDALGGSAASVLLNDSLSVVGFSGVWFAHAKGYRQLAPAILLVVGNAGILHGVIEVGADPELRTVFLPLVMLPFLVVDMTARWTLAAFMALPIAEYFITGAFVGVGAGLAHEVYRVYVPILSFTMMIAGSVVFAYVDRRADERVLRMHERAAQNARMVALGEMSSGIAHEIKNPLAAIRLAASQIVARPAATPQVVALGERIERIVMRASRIIDALRSFARDAGGDPLEAVAVARIVADAVELCGQRFTESAIELTTDVPPELVVTCRHVQLAQVLVNLLNNAFDAAAAVDGPRTVTIAARATPSGHAELAVTDSGPGVPAAARARIFEPFYTTKGPDRGTGIGLSLSRGIVEAHGGTLVLDEASPRTRFVMTIPA